MEQSSFCGIVTPSAMYLSPCVTSDFTVTGTLNWFSLNSVWTLYRRRSPWCSYF
jgi:hypothetical protein